MGTPKAKKENISASTVGSREIHKNVAESLGVPIAAFDTIIAAYWNYIVKEIEKSHHVLIKEIMSITPYYIHGYSGISLNGLEYEMKSRVSLYVRLQKRVRDAKKSIAEEYNLNKEE